MCDAEDVGIQMMITLLLLLLAALDRLVGAGRFVLRVIMFYGTLLAPRIGGIGMWMYAAGGAETNVH